MTIPSFIEHRGCRLAYHVRGAGESVLVIQGAGVEGDRWRPQVDALATRYRCRSGAWPCSARSAADGMPGSAQ